VVNKKQMLSLIGETLQEIGLHSEDAVSLVYNTGLVESKYEYLYQKGGSHVARGFFQCEPHNAVDICKNYLAYRDELMREVASACMIDWRYFTSPNEDAWRIILTYNIKAQIAMCRLHWRRVPKKLPKTIKGQAEQWKQYYNTASGKGTVDHFIKLVEAYG
jgi:hypothetical protein